MAYHAPFIAVPNLIPIDELSGGKKWQIEEVSGPHGHVSFACDRSILFGRDAACCNLIFDGEAGISRVHCSVEPTAQGVLLNDLNSEEGTFWRNGIPVRRGCPVLLQRGDTFVVGAGIAVFRVA